MKPTKICAEIAGSSFGFAPPATTARAAAEMLPDTAWSAASVPIARAENLISTKLLELESTTKVCKG